MRNWLDSGGLWFPVFRWALGKSRYISLGFWLNQVFKGPWVSEGYQLTALVVGFGWLIWIHEPVFAEKWTKLGWLAALYRPLDIVLFALRWLFVAEEKVESYKRSLAGFFLNLIEIAIFFAIAFILLGSPDTNWAVLRQSLGAVFTLTLFSEVGGVGWPIWLALVQIVAVWILVVLIVANVVGEINRGEKKGADGKKERNVTDEQRRKRLLGWFKEIEGQAQRLAVDHHIYKEVTDMVADNKRLEEQGSNEFFRWMHDNFIVTSAVAVRRQADRNPRSISMRRFLEELHSNPHLISRQYFLDLHKDSNAPEDLTQRTYDRIVGKGRNELDPAQVQQEIEELERRTDLIKHIVDKTFAHTDKKGPSKPTPKFKDLEDCIDFFEGLVKRYYLLLYASSLTSLLPTFQYEWKEIFRSPWIEDE